jgi:hypothetical protein
MVRYRGGPLLVLTATQKKGKVASVSDAGWCNKILKYILELVRPSLTEDDCLVSFHSQLSG